MSEEGQSATALAAPPPVPVVPAQRGRSRQEHLHRFMGVRSGRKLHYARLMAGALDLDRVPTALNNVLDHVV